MEEQSKNDTMRVTIICWKCDLKFQVTLNTLTRKSIVYLDDGPRELVTQQTQPKRYLIRCPNPDCNADNEVPLP